MKWISLSPPPFLFHDLLTLNLIWIAQLYLTCKKNKIIRQVHHQFLPKDFYILNRSMKVIAITIFMAIFAFSLHFTSLGQMPYYGVMQSDWNSFAEISSDILAFYMYICYKMSSLSLSAKTGSIWLHHTVPFLMERSALYETLSVFLFFCFFKPIYFFLLRSKHRFWATVKKILSDLIISLIYKDIIFFNNFYI